jgi:hypothetical protein
MGNKGIEIENFRILCVERRKQTMQLSSIISAAKKNGVTFKEAGNRFYLTKGDTTLEGYLNSENEVGYLTWRSPDTDAMTDCFCDSYYHTIKSAMHLLNPTGEGPVRVITTEQVLSAADPSPKDDTAIVRKNEEKGGIEILFASKPADEIIADLKAHGFRWSPYNSVWWKKYSDADMAWANDRFIPLLAGL